MLKDKDDKRDNNDRESETVKNQVVSKSLWKQCNDSGVCKKKKIEGATPVAATTSGIEGASLEKMRGAEMKKKHKPFIVRVIPALYKIIKNIQFHLEKMMRIGRIFQVGNPLLRLILRVTMLLETVKPLSTTLSKF